MLACLTSESEYNVAFSPWKQFYRFMEPLHLWCIKAACCERDWTWNLFNESFLCDFIVPWTNTRIRNTNGLWSVHGAFNEWRVIHSKLIKSQMKKGDKKELLILAVQSRHPAWLSEMIEDRAELFVLQLKSMHILLFTGVLWNLVFCVLSRN